MFKLTPSNTEKTRKEKLKNFPESAPNYLRHVLFTFCSRFLYFHKPQIKNSDLNSTTPALTWKRALSALFGLGYKQKQSKKWRNKGFGCTGKDFWCFWGKNGSKK
jgi:hypothetical protein